MIDADAKALIADVLAPLLPATLWDAVRASVPLSQTGSASASRAGLLGEDAEATLLAAHATHAPILDCHTIEPLGPPPGPKRVADAAEFAALIAAYHDRGYTVRFPEVRALTPQLLTFVRALEAILHQPVEASVFWSRTGARAKIHYDNNDNLVIHLTGKKRWFVSTAQAGLQNPWRDIAEAASHLEAHSVIDVEPGDLLYTPRGLPHSVVSTSDSIHLAILFTPLTLRAALIAAIDHLSEGSRSLRATASDRPDLSHAFAELADQCRQPGFVEAALERRKGRAVADLDRLVPPVAEPSLGPATHVRHAGLSTAHLRATGTTVELALPGGRIALHGGAAPALRFILATRGFAVREVPGLAPDVAAALVRRLVAAGLLEVVS